MLTSLRRSRRLTVGAAAAVVAVVASTVVAPPAFSAATATAERPRVRTVAVPEGIASDCSADVTGPLTAWLAKVRNRSTLEFGRGACYRVDGTLRVIDRRHLTFDGNGATVQAFTDGDQGRRHFMIVGGRDIVVRHLTVRGAKPQESGYSAARAFQHGFAVAGATNVLLRNVAAYDVWGDFVYVGSAGAKERWSENVRVERSTFERCGRQGIAITAGRDVVIRDNRIADAGRSLFDLEANRLTGGAIDVRVVRNTTGAARNFWVANKGAGPQTREIVFADNVMTEPTGGLVFVYGGLGEYRGPYTFVRNRLVITGTARDEGSRGAFFLSRAADVEIRDNVVVLPAGAAMPVVESRDSLDIVIDGNDVHNGGELLIETSRAAPPPSTAAP